MASAWGYICVQAGRYDEAIEQCRRALGLDANYALAHGNLSWGYFWKGLHEEAAKEFEKSARLWGNDVGMGLPAVYAATGRRDQVQKVLHRVTEQSKRGEVPAPFVARTYVRLGDKERAFDWLEKA